MHSRPDLSAINLLLVWAQFESFLSIAPSDGMKHRVVLVPNTHRHRMISCLLILIVLDVRGEHARGTASQRTATTRKDLKEPFPRMGTVQMDG